MITVVRISRDRQGEVDSILIRLLFLKKRRTSDGAFCQNGHLVMIMVILDMLIIHKTYTYYFIQIGGKTCFKGFQCL